MTLYQCYCLELYDYLCMYEYATPLRAIVIPAVLILISLECNYSRIYLD